MRFSGSKMFVCCARFRDYDHLAMAQELQARLPGLACIGVLRGEPRANMVSLDDVAAGRGAPAGFVPAPADADGVMRMAFTSGTTGNPKGVMHSHNTTLAATRILNGDLGLGADDVMMIWLPLGLNWGYLTLVQAVLAGAKAVLLDRFRPAAALDLLERERVTYIPTAPASLTALLQEPDMARRNLSSLRFVVSDGPSVHLGYHNNPAANAEAFLADGWFRSGDLGMIDAQGNLHIVGRLKEMINRGGKKFFPREIEEI